MPTPQQPHTPQQTSLLEIVAAALAASDTDDALAQALVTTGAVTAALDRATLSDGQVQDQLDYAPGSFRAAAARFHAFPDPVSPGRRWSREAIDHYASTHRRKRRR